MTARGQEETVHGADARELFLGQLRLPEIADVTEAQAVHLDGENRVVPALFAVFLVMPRVDATDLDAVFLLLCDAALGAEDERVAFDDGDIVVILVLVCDEKN